MSSSSLHEQDDSFEGFAEWDLTEHWRKHNSWIAVHNNGRFELLLHPGGQQRMAAEQLKLKMPSLGHASAVNVGLCGVVPWVTSIAPPHSLVLPEYNSVCQLWLLLILHLEASISTDITYPALRVRRLGMRASVDSWIEYKAAKES